MFCGSAAEATPGIAAPSTVKEVRERPRIFFVMFDAPFCGRLPAGVQPASVLRKRPRKRSRKKLAVISALLPDQSIELELQRRCDRSRGRACDEPTRLDRADRARTEARD